MFTWYTVLLTVHVLSAVIWVGGGTAFLLLTRRAIASGDRQYVANLMGSMDFIGPRIYAPLSVALLVTGFFLVDKIGVEISDLWVLLALLGWLISFLIGVVFYSRSARQRAAIVAAEGLEGDGYIANVRLEGNVALFEVVLLLLVVADMTLKPGA